MSPVAAMRIAHSSRAWLPALFPERMAMTPPLPG
jgi:hypothetical protein